MTVLDTQKYNKLVSDTELMIRVYSEKPTDRRRIDLRTSLLNLKKECDALRVQLRPQIKTKKDELEPTEQPAEPAEEQPEEQKKKGRCKTKSV